MIKEELIKALAEGLKLNRISQTQYDEALNLFTLIYEEKQASESSDTHANLCKLINLASAYDPKSSESSAEVIEAELKASQEFLSQHPVLQYSPLDLERDGVDVDKYLEGVDKSTRELYKEYYDVER